MSSDAPRKACQALPRNRAVLEVMFRHCDECLKRADTAVHRSKAKIDILFAWGDGKIAWQDAKERLQQIDKVHRLDRDTFAPEVEALWPYCNPEQLAEVDELFRQGELAVSDNRQIDEQFAHQVAMAGIALIKGQRLHAFLLRSLKDRIFGALEAKGADTGADTAAHLAGNAPRNDAIALLYLKIERDKGFGKSESDIALDFTDGDRTRAQTLLRGVRRYRKRLSGS